MTVPTTYKAAIVPKAGAKLTIVSDRQLPPLGPGEVAIKITATAINPVDWKLLGDHSDWLKHYPAILGSDAAGTIAALGPDVTSFAVGDRVFFQGIIGNYDASTFAQYCKMPAALVAKTPANITDDQAAGISLASLAVITGLYDNKTGSGLKAPWDAGGEQAGKGKALVVLGGSSSVGQYAIQMAKLSGFERIITNSSARHVDFLKSLGADVVLDRAVHSSAEDFKAAVGGVPLAFVFDSISDKETQILGVEVLGATKTEGSHVITVTGVNAEAKERGEAQEPKVEIKNILGLGSSPALRYLSEPFFKNLGGEDGYIAKGRFAPNRPLVIAGGLGGLEDALAKNKQGVSGEKVVIRPNDE